MQSKHSTTGPWIMLLSRHQQLPIAKIRNVEFLESLHWLMPMKKLENHRLSLVRLEQRIRVGCAGFFQLFYRYFTFQCCHSWVDNRDQPIESAEFLFMQLDLLPTEEKSFFSLPRPFEGRSKSTVDVRMEDKTSIYEAAAQMRITTIC